MISMHYITLYVKEILSSPKKVSVSENLVSEKKFRFRLQKNLVSEKSLGFGKFGFGKKVSVSENLVSEKSLGFGFRKFGIGKKSQYWFRSKFWYRHSVMVG